MTSKSKCTRYSITVTPTVFLSPIQGSIQTARSILRGVLNGTWQGIANSQWGADSSVIGVSNIHFEGSDGKELIWVNELLYGLELEHDLDVIRIVSSMAKDKAQSILCI